MKGVKMYKLEIKYKDENLDIDEIEFTNKETADYYYREYQQNKDVAYCKIIKC